MFRSFEEAGISEGERDVPCARLETMAKLKVFRTPIGFHDAYVAAPSQKAALEAWGADADLFARGIAERVDDPSLTKEPLARPGEVIKVTRGGPGDHFKAIGAAPKRRKSTVPGDPRDPPVSKIPEAEPPVANRQRPRKKPKPKPRPSRAQLERAEAALAAVEAEHLQRLADLAARRKALEEGRKALEEERRVEQSGYAAKTEKLEAARQRARAAYQAKVEQWAAE